MPSLKLKARTCSLILLWTTLAVVPSACVQAPPVFQTANPCSQLIPEDWYTVGVESAPLPADKTAGGWVSFGVAQTGQLDKANKQTKDTVEIVKRCEARDEAAFNALQPKPWYKFWQ